MDLLGRKARREADELRKIAQDLYERNKRLSSDLREMDSGLYSIVQAAPDFKLMQPYIQKLNSKVEYRMKSESHRITNVIIEELERMP